MGYIYLITNIVNKKQYVGQTQREDIQTRWNAHKKSDSKSCGSYLLRAYKKYKIENFKFQIICICFDEDCNRFEEEYIKKEYKIRDRQEKIVIPNDTPENIFRKFEAIPIYERQLEKFINPFKMNWQQRYYKCLFNIDIDEERKRQICTNYLEGLEWTFKYYTSGCIDWRWCYHYNYPPLLSDLIHYVPFFEIDLITKKEPSPVNELVQLCYVLPKDCLHLLPSKLYNELIDKKSYWYKSDCEFIWAFCKYFWESHVDLPDIDINELEEFVKENK